VSEVQASSVLWIFPELAGHLSLKWASILQFRWGSSCERKRGARQSHKRLPYSSIKVSNTSLDHLLLGKAADEMIISLCLTAGQICVREPDRLAAIWGPHSEMTPFLRNYPGKIVAGQFVNLISNVASFRSTRRGGSLPDTRSSTRLAIVCDQALK
jgi:hypothetical protein